MILMIIEKLPCKSLLMLILPVKSVTLNSWVIFIHHGKVFKHFKSLGFFLKNRKFPDVEADMLLSYLMSDTPQRPRS